MKMPKAAAKGLLDSGTLFTARLLVLSSIESICGRFIDQQQLDSEIDRLYESIKERTAHIERRKKGRA